MNDVEKVPREPKISIGMPVYNSEKFIRRALDGLLSQTYSDFEIIISDNASTDFTPKICEEYLKKDKRIRYFRQEQNMGGHWNFMFVLQQAKCKYFKWIAPDDIYLPDFLEKNISILESNKNLVGSISRIDRFGPKFDVLNANPNDSFFTKIRKRIQLHLMTSLDVVSFYGTYEKKVRLFMYKRIPIMFYAVFRTDILKKSVMDDLFVNNDTSM
ncbi:MAG: glycosyltransferase, partial [Ignavibacteria bacterium]